MQPKLTLNSWFFCFHFPSAGTTSKCHHYQFWENFASEILPDYSFLDFCIYFWDYVSLCYLGWSRSYFESVYPPAFDSPWASATGIHWHAWLWLFYSLASFKKKKSVHFLNRCIQVWCIPVKDPIKDLVKLNIHSFSCKTESHLFNPGRSRELAK